MHTRALLKISKSCWLNLAIFMINIHIVLRLNPITILIKTFQSKRLERVYLFVYFNGNALFTSLHLVTYKFWKLQSTFTLVCHTKRQISQLIPIVWTCHIWATSDVVYPTVTESVDKLRRLLPDNSSRPPTRIQAATLKRNKKATWQRFLHSLHFLRGSHGISMFSLLFVSSR